MQKIILALIVALACSTAEAQPPAPRYHPYYIHQPARPAVDWGVDVHWHTGPLGLLWWRSYSYTPYVYPQQQQLPPPQQ